MLLLIVIEEISLWNINNVQLSKASVYKRTSDNLISST